MVELVGDLCIPSELILPETTTPKGLSGQLTMSGARVCFFNGTNYQLLTED